MRGTKKMLSVLLVMSLSVIIVLSGCGGTSNVASTQDKAGTTAASREVTTAAQELPYSKLTFYYPEMPQKDQQLVQDAMNKILKA